MTTPHASAVHLLLPTLLLVLGIATPGAAQPAHLAGQVLTADGQPVAAAVVTLWTAQTPTATATSDATGRFQFPGVGPGEFRLTATAIGRLSRPMTLPGLMVSKV